MEDLEKNRFVRRLWEKDATLWKTEPKELLQISNSLGWLTVVDWMIPKLKEITDFAVSIKSLGFKDVVLLGMGGSSLAAELFRASLPSQEGYPALHVLDSTDPDWIDNLECSIHLSKTLFIYASKSGTTIEPASFFNYFYDRTNQKGEQFIAITDPGTFLEKFAKEKQFLKIFLNPPDIGGRFSALSYFGLVPAALGGKDIGALVKSAKSMMEQCQKDSVDKENPAVSLGSALGELYKQGKDKLTFILPKSLETLGLWIEQLIAESSGKDGKGLVPVVGEELLDPKSYGKDRVFIRIKNSSPKLPSEENLWKKLGETHPLIEIEVPQPTDLGGEFIRWEIATATACALMGVNAFDQPDVQLAKDQTKYILSRIVKEGGLTMEKPHYENEDFQMRMSRAAQKQVPLPPAEDPLNPLKTILKNAQPHQYIGLLAFLPNDSATENTLNSMRNSLRTQTGLATLFGFGPRYLHSTGQLHKGGPNHGLFILITKESKKPIPIPGEKYSFEELELAQGVGDFQALEGKERPVIHFHLKAPFSKSLTSLSNKLCAHSSVG